MPVAYMNDEVVVKEAQRRLQAHLPINWEGTQYNPTHAWTVLIGGVGMGASIAAMCREGREVPSGNIVRETLNEQGWDDCFIETACNALLAQSARECSWKGWFPVAIDLHEEPFYGKRPEDDPEVIRRGKAKAGTTSFHTFATAYVIRRHRRLTLAVTRVRAHQSMLAVADRLRRRVEELGIKVQVYLLNRQFWTTELQMAWKAIPYILPLRRTGKPGTQGGTRPLFDLQESQWTTYTLTPDPQEPLEIDVAVVVLPETREARQKRLAKVRAAYDQALKRVEEKAPLLAEGATAQNKRALTGAKNAFAKAQARLEEERMAHPLTTLCYAINQVSHWSLKRIYATYRGRFGIESSYRQSRQARIFTTSRKPWFRFLIFGLSLILRNLWLEVRWLVGEPKRGRGGRKSPKICFLFRCFCGGWFRRPGRPYVSEPGFPLKVSCQTHCGGFRELLRLGSYERAPYMQKSTTNAATVAVRRNTMPPTRDNADFLTLYRSICAMGASILRAGAALTATQREALIADLRSGDEERAKAALPLLGISQSTIDEQRPLVSNFVAQHPLPEGRARVQFIVETAFAAAKKSYTEEAGGGPAPDPLDEILDELDLPGPDESGGSEGNTACLAGCEAQAIVLGSLAFATYTSALALCVAAGPFWPACAAAATAAYALDIYLMDAAIDRCVANCG